MIHASSAALTVNARYSASVEDLEIVGCFLEAQVRRLLPRKIRKPVVDLRSTGLPTQLESVKAVRRNGPG
jgi:hypothetical protein